MSYEYASILVFGLGFLLAACVPAENAPVENPDADQLPAVPIDEQVTASPTEEPDMNQTPPDPASPAEDSPVEQPTDAPRVAEGSPIPGSGVQAPVQVAIQDLAERLNVDVAQIELREARAVTWPDASLGCPQPGIAYTQAPQDGLLIRLWAGGEAYHYHSGGSREPFLCEESAGLFKVTPKPGEEFVPPPGFDE
jgi:hypothetical protein